MKLALIDGHSLAYRAFFALPPEMATSQGELTNATFGFLSMLLNVLRDQQPTHIAVAFDVGRSFRQDQFEAYKATRERMPDELRSQIERIQEVVEAFNIPIFTAEGYEADDVLATLARQAAAQGVSTLIVTGDRDLLQTVTERIHVLTSGRRFSDVILYDPARVRERYDLAPSQLIDLKAMVGDKSDNIPGVYGVGEKGATKLLHEWDDLDGIYAHLQEVTPARTRAALSEHRDTAYLSRALATIVDVPGLTLDLAACVLADYDRQRVLKLLADLEFNTLVGRLPDAAPAGAQLSLFAAEDAAPPALPTPPQGYRAITAPAELDAVAAALAASERIAFDVETTATDEHRAQLVGVALAWGAGPDHAVYIPIAHTAGQQLALAQVQAAIGPHLADPGKEKLAHNAKYDLIVCRRHGLPIHGPLRDTMIGEFLLDPGSHSLGLKALALKRLGVEMTPIVALIGKGNKQITMDQVSSEAATPYAAADVDMTWRLAAQILPELAAKGLDGLFYDLEMPLIPVLADMEMAGVLFDADFLTEMSQTLAQRLQTLATEIYADVGHSFNLNSTQKLSDALFGSMGLPAAGLKKNASGHYSTAADVLERLRWRHPVIDRLIEYRQLVKLQGTYVEALPKLINPLTGRIHTSFDQTGAETGRISSNNPNLQNIPVRTQLGRQIRKAFVAPPGHFLLAVDYSQVELRILAHLSGDEAMLANFAHGRDIHAAAASQVYGVPIDQVNSEQRAVAKMMNFATSYGVSAFGLSARTPLSVDEARRFMNAYFAAYPGVKRYLDATIALAKKQGYVETLLGRRRYFPILQTGAGGAAQVRAAAERAAVNHPIQGSAADILKLALLAVHRRLREEGLAARMILQVHDEIVLETPEEELDATARLVTATMEAAYTLRAPLRAEPEFGRDWYDLQKWGG